VVEPFGNELLAGAALADHKHWPIERRSAAGSLNRVEKREALPDKLFGPFHGPTVGGESHHLARIFGCRGIAELLIPYFSVISAYLARLLYGRRQV
jgi:hypothetical protein